MVFRAALTEQELKAIIEAIRVTKTEAELAKIVHASTKWGHMDETAIKLFHHEVDKQRTFLDELRYIATMTLEQRERLILYYARFPEHQALADFARDMQTQVKVAIDTLVIPDDPVELNNKALETAIYVSRHSRDADATNSLNIEYLERLNTKITKMEREYVAQVLNNANISQEQKIADLTQHIADLRSIKIKAKAAVGEFNDYVNTLRKSREGSIYALEALHKQTFLSHGELLTAFKNINPAFKSNNLGPSYIFNREQDAKLLRAFAPGTPSAIALKN